LPESDLALLTSAALRAGEIARRHFRSDHAVWDKGDGQGPVTEADLEVDRMLRDSLIAARPDHGWLSEETPDSPERLDKERVFIVDPIDGTRAFAEGHRTWAHSIALACAGQVVAAVVYLPMLERLFAASLGQGARLNGHPVAASTRTELNKSTVLAATPTLDPRNWSGPVPAFERHFRSSLAYRLSLIGQGRFDTMLALRDSWEWDIAAGGLIAAEAGAVVSDRFGATLRFNTPERMSRGIVATAPGLHPQIIDRLA
jgi:myo-inositol-1(or 4)-monophosphatase